MFTRHILFVLSPGKHRGERWFRYCARFDSLKTTGWKSSGRAQAKYLYSLGRNNNGRFGGDRGPFLWNRAIAVQPPRAFLPSRNGNYFAHSSKGGGIFVLHNGLFSRSLKRRKILRLLSRARLGERESILESRRADERISINFRQAGYRRQCRIARAENGKKKKKLPFYSISRKKLREPFASEGALIGARRDARTTRDRKTFAYTRTSPYHFNGILNSRRRVPKLMQSQFPGSCAWYISDFPPLRYRLESSPSHAAVPERLVSPNNRLLPSANWSRRARPSPPPLHALDGSFYAEYLN